MCAKKTFRKKDIDATLKNLLNAPEIPEAERELSREDAFKLMAEGFRALLNQGYSIKGVLNYLKGTDCPIKDIKHGEIAGLLQSEEKPGETKRKSHRTTGKTSTGNMPELKETEKSRGGDKREEETLVKTEGLNAESGSFSLADELSLDEL